MSLSAVVMLALGVLSIVLAATRLDALAARAPGVWRAQQIMPIQAAWFRDGDGGPQGEATEGLKALLDPLSSDLYAGSWYQAHDRLVAVGVAAVSNPADLAMNVNGAAPTAGLQTIRA